MQRIQLKPERCHVDIPSLMKIAILALPVSVSAVDLL